MTDEQVKQVVTAYQARLAREGHPPSRIDCDRTTAAFPRSRQLEHVCWMCAEILAAVAAGAGASFGFKVDRQDGFDGPIRVELTNLPKGFTATTPVDVDPGHLSAEATLFAAEDAKGTPADWRAVKITATATLIAREEELAAAAQAKAEATRLKAEPTLEAARKQNADYLDALKAYERPLQELRELAVAKGTAL